jgi:hypothetical protein
MMVNRIMTQNKTVLAAHLDGETVLLHMDSKRYFRLNATAQRIWQLLEQKLDTDAIVEALTTEFEVTADDARAAVVALVADLKQHSLSPS